MMQGFKKSFNIQPHPFLFALFPVISLFSYNYDIVPLRDLILPVVFMQLLAFSLIISLRRLFKPSAKAGILATLAIFLFSSYGHFYNLFIGFVSRFSFAGHNAEAGFGFSTEPSVIIAYAFAYILISVTFFVLVGRTKGDLSRVSGALNVCGFALVLPLIVVISINMPTKPPKPDIPASAAPPPTAVRTSRTLPDIYYIILDGYAREDILKEHYHFDNKDFLTALKRLGFQVADKSMANYPWTFLSLASSLNYMYINQLAESVGRESRDRKKPYEMIRNNHIVHFLKSQGYRYVHIDSTWSGTLANPNADIEIEYSKSILKKEFFSLWLSTTPFKLLERTQEAHLAARHLFSYSQLKASYKIPGPKFVFFHSLPPHHPYLFNRSGKVHAKVHINTQFRFEVQLWWDKEKYLEQLRFVSDRILAAVSQIIRKSTQPPIIVIQSDHGPSLSGVGQEEFYKARFAILNACYFPNAPGIDCDSFSPVNLFRVIFNKYFSTDLEILEDKRYFSEYRQPYDFREVLGTGEDASSRRNP